VNHFSDEDVSQNVTGAIADLLPDDKKNRAENSIVDSQVDISRFTVSLFLEKRAHNDHKKADIFSKVTYLSLHSSHSSKIILNDISTSLKSTTYKTMVELHLARLQMIDVFQSRAYDGLKCYLLESTGETELINVKYSFTPQVIFKNLFISPYVSSRNLRYLLGE